MLEKLMQKISKQERTAGFASNPFMGRLTKTALDLYEKQCDINRFTNMVLEDLENYNGLDELLETRMVVDPFEDEKLFHLGDNSKFLHDLGLTDR